MDIRIENQTVIIQEMHFSFVFCVLLFLFHQIQGNIYLFIYLYTHNYYYAHYKGFFRESTKLHIAKKVNFFSRILLF